MRARSKEKLVYQVVREAAKERRRATVSEVVAATGLARSSVYRVARKLGYESWVDFTSGLVRYYAQARPDSPIASSVEAVSNALLKYRDKPILIDAVGDAEICESYLLYRLGERGFTSLPFSNSTARSRGGEAGAGIVFVINESGMSLLPSCIVAAEHGFEVISITSSHDTPVSKLSAINVVISNNKSSLSDYEPNYFAAGSIAFLALVLKRLGIERPLG